MIIAEVRMVPSMVARSMASVRRRRQAASASAAITPSAAASVGVARPA